MRIDPMIDGSCPDRATWKRMTLLDHLSSWSAADLSYLMERRPDLLPASDRGLEAVARKAATAMSIGRALVAADVGMLVVAEALVASAPASPADIDRLLGTDDVTAVAEAVERLRRTGIVVVENGVIFPVGSLPDLLHRPLGLGPSFEELAEHLPSETVAALASTVRAEGTDRRSATIRAVAHRLREPETLDLILEGAPEDSQALLFNLVSHRSPAVPLPTGYPYRGLDDDDPLAWLIETGLVVPVTENGAELPREIVMAAMADGLARQAMLRRPAPAEVDGLVPDVVAGTSADAANRLLDGAETLLRLIADGQVSVRKAGGVGPRELKRLSKLCRLDTHEVVRLLELLAVARLLTVTGRGLAPSELASRWWTLARRRRYLVLVRAWLASERFLSRGLIDGSDDPTSADGLVALGDTEPVAAAVAGRAVALATICGLEDGAAFHPDQLAEAVVWQGPNLWGAGDPPPEMLVDWTVAEAELLGLVSGDAPTPLLRAIESRDEVQLDRAAATALTDDQDGFVLQSDLTAVAFGPLRPAVGRSLAEMTERSAAIGEGQAPTFRFTEPSVRAAFDRGWDGDSITAFLNEHALSGIPQPLEYLLADVARRYGSIRVMPAQSIIIGADEIVAVEVAANRRAAKLGLRLVAPTVLTSPLDPVTVTEGLREIGLFPTLDGTSIALDGRRSIDGDDEASSPRGASGQEHGSDLPADWTGPPLPSGPFPDEVDEAVSALLELSQPDAADGRTHAEERPPPVHSGADVGAGFDPDGQPGGPDQMLRAFWGRPVVVEGLVDGALTQIHGTVVGLGSVVSLLTTDGVVELPADAVLTTSDPRAV